jgi:hypothetical protein
MRIKQAIQVGSNVTDIFKLPCIKSVRKCDDQNGLEWIEYDMADGGIVECGDWLCEMEDGKWQPMSDEEYMGFK